MTFELYSEAVLTRDLPEHNLRRGDVVVVIDHHVACDGEEGYSIEVFNATGDTIAVATVSESHLEPLRSDEVLCARVLQPAA
jgi:nanoRNase/pAp phosphatase (c-di-AMP/oligoRNAs hydrolase)